MKKTYPCKLYEERAAIAATFGEDKPLPATLKEAKATLAAFFPHFKRKAPLLTALYNYINREQVFSDTFEFATAEMKKADTEPLTVRYISQKLLRYFEELLEGYYYYTPISITKEVIIAYGEPIHVCTLLHQYRTYDQTEEYIDQAVTLQNTKIEFAKMGVEIYYTDKLAYRIDKYFKSYLCSYGYAKKQASAEINQLEVYSRQAELYNIAEQLCEQAAEAQCAKADTMRQTLNAAINDYTIIDAAKYNMVLNHKTIDRNEKTGKWEVSDFAKEYHLERIGKFAKGIRSLSADLQGCITAIRTAIKDNAILRYALDDIILYACTPEKYESKAPTRMADELVNEGIDAPSKYYKSYITRLEKQGKTPTKEQLEYALIDDVTPIEPAQIIFEHIKQLLLNDSKGLETVTLDELGIKQQY